MKPFHGKKQSNQNVFTELSLDWKKKKKKNQKTKKKTKTKIGTQRSRGIVPASTSIRENGRERALERLKDWKVRKAASRSPSNLCSQSTLSPFLERLATQLHRREPQTRTRKSQATALWLLSQQNSPHKRNTTQQATC
jgi:CelD/BcsL family acetyltransferase involved in cellulose biosynthesis